MEREIIWVTVNTNSNKEADKIGLAVLKARLCACYGIIPRIKSVYYWPTRLARKKGRLASPPKLSQIQTSKGPLLTLETLPKHYQKIIKLVKSLHSDKVPFIGQWEMDHVDPAFYNWLKGEIR